MRYVAIIERTMALEQAFDRIVERMTPSERATYDNGCKIVDWLMDIALDKTMPPAVRDEARSKLRACALRKPSETVQDVVGTKH